MDRTGVMLSSIQSVTILAQCCWTPSTLWPPSIYNWTHIVWAVHILTKWIVNIELRRFFNECFLARCWRLECKTSISSSTRLRRLRRRLLTSYPSIARVWIHRGHTVHTKLSVTYQHWIAFQTKLWNHIYAMQSASLSLTVAFPVFLLCPMCCRVGNPEKSCLLLWQQLPQDQIITGYFTTIWLHFENNITVHDEHRAHHNQCFFFQN